MCGCMYRAEGERLLPAEAEAFVSELKTFRVKHVGSDKYVNKIIKLVDFVSICFCGCRWTMQRERLEKLHLQVHF